MLDYKSHKYVENVSVTSIKDMIKKDLKECMKIDLIKSQAIKKEYMSIEEFKVTLKMLDINYEYKYFENSIHKQALVISFSEFIKKPDIQSFIEDLIQKNNLNTKIIYSGDYINPNDLCIYFD